MLRINELPYALELGTMFEHTRQGDTYAYRVLGIEIGDEWYNDKITLQDRQDMSLMEVEPEWFNQRKIRITTKVNLYLWFGNELAYHLDITPEKAENIIKGYTTLTDYSLEVVL